MISAPGEPPGSRVSTTSMPTRLEPLGQQRRMRGLAAALAAFEGDESSRASTFVPVPALAEGRS